ncbi:MAG: hypothetical protein LJE69_08430 [Thiohalocapsa sp.]|jgi:hypothetical protein|uniref:hypothetical protein n=1 Tax=Thiohalocapsa sp. TaxID=2497641 RepID=UPI0025FC40B6|nr:hypothetical protein [Thiohalocapsa sp.]MCG6941263.1 hypothetical protein [Thiohalocapsa sp.]
MSEETATPPASTTSTPTRRATASRRRATPKPTATGPALPPERDDAYQAAPRIWPD